MKKILIVLALSILTLPVAAQKGNIGFVYPSGAQKGTTIELTVGGQNLSKATGIIFSGEGVSGELIPSPATKSKKKKKKKNIGEEDNLQLADQVKFRITVAPDAASGIRDVRLMLPNGITNRLYFEVGELPDVCENRSSALSGEATSLPVTFNGQIMRSDVDRFRFHATKGQQLVIRVKARIFVPYMADAVPGWFQPIARLYGPDGKEVAFNDDYTFHVDPIILFKVPKSGAYELELNDALYRGREDFVYRADVGELPFITSISPIGGPVGRKTSVTLKGVNLKTGRLTLKPRKEGLQAISVSSSRGISSNTVYFDATTSTALKTSKLVPNTMKASAWKLDFGTCAEGVISEPMQQHWYTFSVDTRKQAVHAAVVARQAGAPTDIRMTVFNEYGDEVLDVDDFEDEDDCLTTHFADPQFTKPLPGGTYYIRLVESQGHGGPEFRYRLYLSKASPDFSLHLEPSTFSVPAGGTGIFNALLTRKQNFNGEVNIDVKGLPRGFSVSGNTIRPRQKKAIISITAPAGAEKKTLNPEVVGTASGKDGDITRKGIPVESMMQAFYYKHLMPIDEFRMEVAEPQPFKLSVVRTWNGELELGAQEMAIKVRVERTPGFKSPVTLMLKSSQQFVKAEAVVIGENETEGTLIIKTKPQEKRKKETYVSLVVTGVLKASSKKIAGKSRNAYTAAVTAYTPVFEAKVLPVRQK